MTNIFIGLGQIALLLIICFVAVWVRNKFPVVETYWSNGVAWLFIAIFLIHMGIWWLWPTFWSEWKLQSGFLFFQILFGIGFYLRVGLKDKKFLKHLGLILVVLGLIGIGWNLSTGYLVSNSVNDVMAPGAMANLPPQNKEVEKEVTKFWMSEIPKQSALAMLRIVRRKSGFNQFGKDGKPYRNPNDLSKVGVMQINDTLWQERAVELGYNLYELEGNLDFALWLYKEQGFTPWRPEESDGIDTALSAWDKFKDLFRKKKGSGSRNTATLNPDGTFSTPSAPLPALNEEGARAARQAFLNASFTAQSAEKMVGICHRESGCNQFEKDGKTPMTGRVNPRDKGLYQINLDWWNKELSIYGTPEIRSWDVNTLEGNLKIAVYLRKKYGLAPWKATSSFKEAFITATEIRSAPVGGWSEPVKFTDRVATIWYSGNVTIRDERGRIFHSGPNHRFVEIGKVQTLEFMSEEDEPVVVTINYTN